MKRRILAVLLSLCMLFSLLPATAFAAGDPVTYIERSWDGNSVQGTEQTCNSYTSVDASTTEWTNGWYVVDSDVTIDGRISAVGTVNLILVDGTTLTANSGINLGVGSTLNIYGQNTDSGKLIATQSPSVGFLATIGGGQSKDSGQINIHGGDITANNVSSSGACIGGGSCPPPSAAKGGGKVTIYGGSVTATSSSSAAAIGGGNYGYSTVKIYGGNIDASAGNGAAIGGGQYSPDTFITICGGTVTATSTGGWGIGGGQGNPGNHTFSTGENGAAVITASGGQGAISDNDDTSKWSCILIDGTDTTVYGHQTMTNKTVNSDETLTIAPGAVLTNNGTLTNKGTIDVQGDVDEQGSLSNTGTVNQRMPEAILDSRTADSVTLANISDYAGTKYGYVEGTSSGEPNNWQDSPVFEGLDAGKAYTFYAKFTENPDYYEQTTSDGTTIYTLPSIVDTLPDATVGTLYTATLGTTEEAAVTWKIPAAKLPPGLSLSGNTITGTPTEAGSFKLTVSVIAGGRTIASKKLTLSVGQNTQAAPDAPTSSSAESNSITLNAITSDVGTTTEYGYVEGTEGGTPDSWQTSPTFSNLKAGNAYTFYARFQGNENYAQSPASEGTVIYTPPKIITTTLPEGYAGLPYTAKLEAESELPLTWTCTNGALLSLLAGLTLNEDGTLSGTLKSSSNNLSVNIRATIKGQSIYSDANITLPKPLTPGELTGDVTIGGEAVLGETLTASYSGSEKVSYQWKRNGAILEGETGTTYELTEADLGATISVVVTGTDTVTTSKEASVGPVAKADQNPPEATVVTIDYAGETVAFDDSTYEVSTKNDGSGSPVTTGGSVTPGVNLYVRAKETATEKPSAWVQVTVPARRAAPNVTAVHETVAGRNDGKITGVNTTMEYRLESADDWTDCSGSEVTDLASGTYQVRVKATDSAFAGERKEVTVNAGAQPSYTLTVTAPTFDPVTFGYGQPQAEAIAIHNSGNSDATISKVELTAGDTSSFTISGSGSTVTAGGSINTWMVQPKADLDADTYTATITVTYDGGATATKDVSFTVRRAAITGSVTIDGDAVFGKTLTANYDGIEDVTYQWKRDNANIDNATNKTYVLTADDIGKAISVTVTGTGNYTGEKTSSATKAVAKADQAAPGASEGYAIDYVGESVAANEGYELATVEEAVSGSDSVTATPGGHIYVRLKETATHNASNWTEGTLPARPNAPSTSTVKAVNETVDGNNDGKITGVDTTMEYRLQTALSWTTCSGSEVTDLAPGNYQVRLKATGDTFASFPLELTIATGAAPTYTLDVIPPTFDPVTYGYAQPAAKPIGIRSTGNSDATITSVTLTAGDTSSFTIGGSGDTVTAGETLQTWTIQPAAGLAAKTYTATITVTYDGGATATKDVSFTVRRAAITGTVTIEGDAVFGQTLTASYTGGEDVSYQWKRNGNNIASAINNTYVLTADDIGAAITVTVTGTGNYTGEKTSSATKAVAKADQAAPGASEGYAIDYVGESVAANEGYELATVEEAVSGSDSVTATPGGHIYVRLKETATHNASNWTEGTLPARPSAPSASTVKAVNETVDGNSDGKITGVTTAMEYKLKSGSDWTDCPDGEITNLAPGAYQVRLKATGDSFASFPLELTIATGAAPTYTLDVIPPTFDSVPYGYAQPAAKPIGIRSTGNSDATITKVEFTGANADSFTFVNGDYSVSAGDENHICGTLQPKVGLNAGTYTATITVTYDGGAKAEKSVSFTVKQAAIAGSVTIDGDAVFGKTLTANYAGGEDVSYQWKRDGNNIASATNKTYVLTADDIGTAITVTVTGTGNYTGTKTSDPTNPVAKADQNPPGATVVTINYTDETVTFGGQYEVNTQNGGTGDPVSTGGSVTPGVNLYVRLMETDTHKASDWTEVTVPARPGTPAAPTVESTTGDSLTVTVVSGQEYSLDASGPWQDAGTFSGLTAGHEYTVYTRVKATDIAFASESSSTAVTLLNADGSVKPDADGTVTVPDGEDVTIDTDDDGTGDITVTIPGGGDVTVNPDDGSVTFPSQGGDVVLEDEEGNQTIVTVPGNGSVTPNDNGSVTVPGGSEVDTDGDDQTDVTLPNGGTVNPDGSINLLPDGGTITVPNGGDVVIDTNGDGKGDTTVTVPEGGGNITVGPDGSVTVPEGGSVDTNDDGEPDVTLPEGGTVNPDGSIDIPEGGSVDTDGDGKPDVTLPGGGTVTPKPDGSIDVPGGAQVDTDDDGEPDVTLPDGGTVNPDGSIDIPEGGSVDTDGDGKPDVTLPEGGTVNPDGSITIPEGGTVDTDNDGKPDVTLPDGGTVTPKPDGSIDVPGGTQVDTDDDGEPDITLPDGGTVNPDGSIDVPGGAQVDTDDDGEPDITLPEGGTVNPDGSITIPEGGTVDTDGDGKPEITLPDGGTVTPDPDGSIDVPGGAQVDTDDDGEPDITLPEGGSVNPDGSIDIPEGGTVDTDNDGEPDITLPEGGSVNTDGSIDIPEGGSVDTDGDGKPDIILPDGGTVTVDPDGSIDVPGGAQVDTDDDGEPDITLPDGGTVNPDGSITIPEGGTVDTDGDGKPEITLPDGGTVTVDPDGSIDVPGGAQVDTDDDGEPDITLPEGGTVNPDGSINRPSSSGGGGGSSSYTITVPSGVEHGTITVNVKRASEGDTVTITVKPDEGYGLDQLTVTDAKGNTIELTAGEDGTYTFKMPAAKVSIEVSFIEADQEALPFIDVAEDAWYYDAVYYVYEKGLMEGTSATTFSPMMTTTRGMIVTILYRLEGSPAVVGESSFADVADGAWYTDAVVWANANGIVKGYGNGDFGPNDIITREQMATILFRYASYKGYDVSESADLSDYTDAEQVSDWALAELQWANAEELITGTSAATLTPGGDATRAEAATILMRYCENIAK